MIDPLITHQSDAYPLCFFLLLILVDDSFDSEFEKEIEERDNEDGSSSSDSDIDKFYSYQSTAKNRLFGRQKPVHLLLGGGKCADVIMWRNNKITGCICGGATVIWIIFQWIGYHFLTFVCHFLIVFLGTLFIWSKFASFINISPPEFPKIQVPQDLLVRVALLARNEVNCALKNFHDVASGNDIKKFFMMIVSLWIISVIGGWFDLLTLFYIVFVVVFSAPIMYEKNEDLVDTYAEKGLVELRKQYAVMDEKVLKKLPSFLKQHQS